MVFKNLLKFTDYLVLNNILQYKNFFFFKILFIYLIKIELQLFNIIYYFFLQLQKYCVKFNNKIILFYYFLCNFLNLFMFKNIHNVFFKYIKNRLNLKYFYNFFSIFLINIFKKYVSKIIIINFEINYYLNNPKYLINVLKIFKHEPLLKFKILSDIIVVDYLSQIKRFEIIYTFLSIKNTNRIYLRTFLNDLEMIHTASNIFKSSLWQEREVWDLYGIFFINHPDLRRILTDYGFKGHPLRKDFPLSGFVELFYNYSRKKIVYEPVNLAQKYRNFNFEKKWF